jgi:hypothetical protein
MPISTATMDEKTGHERLTNGDSHDEHMIQTSIPQDPTSMLRKPWTPPTGSKLVHPGKHTHTHFSPSLFTNLLIEL